ncbi:MAG: amino acid ABC transporter substrate-binding protein [Desulfobulbaceae bacterium]|nr:amino acid ABC transporter substrate-binding protein [Desulfobulbaceae bacterium]
MQNVLLTILMVVLFVNPASTEELAGTLQQIQKSGKIKIGYRTSLPPMSFIDKKNTPQGYSIDLCKRIVAGVEKKIGSDILIEYVPVTADQRFDALVDNKIDIMCGVTTNTLSRRELVDFTQITFLTGGSYLTLKGSKIKNNFDGKKIGVVKGTTTAVGLKELFKEEDVNAEIVLIDTTAEGFNGLKKGTIDAFSADQVVLIGLALSADDPGKFTILPDMFSFEPIALAVRRNDADFRLVADRELSHLFRSKEILTIYDRWLGKFANNMPPAFNALIKFNSISE